MKYIKLFESNLEKTIAMKLKIGNKLVEYLTLFGIDCAWRCGGTSSIMTIQKIGAPLELVNIAKYQDFVTIIFSNKDTYDYKSEYFPMIFNDAFTVLLQYINKKGIVVEKNNWESGWGVLVSSRDKNHWYIKVSFYEDFLNVIDECINSGDVELYINMKKYNL